MSKKSLVQRNIKRRTLSGSDNDKRTRLKEAIINNSASADEKLLAMFKLAEMRRNGSKVRIRNRCELTGRPRGNYRKFRMCRIKLRDLASEGMIPGMTKASW